MHITVKSHLEGLKGSGLAWCTSGQSLVGEPSSPCRTSQSCPEAPLSTSRPPTCRGMSSISHAMLSADLTARHTLGWQTCPV